MDNRRCAIGASVTERRGVGQVRPRKRVILPENEGYAREGYYIDKYFIGGDIHWNSAGHELVASEFLAHFPFPPPRTVKP